MSDARVLILLPTAKDGHLAAAAMAAGGLSCRPCADAAELCRELGAGVGVVLLSEDHMLGEAGRCLAPLLRDQPAWSSVPVVVLCHGDDSKREAVMDIAAGATFVERPVRMRTLTSVVRSALRAREHQYAARDAIAALRASESRFRTLVTTTSSIIWATDGAGAIAVENPSWERFTGQRPAEYWGWGWLAAIHPEDRDRTAKHWTRALDALTHYELEYRLRRYDGVYRRVAARGAPIVDSGGKVREWVGNCSDVEAARRREESLRREEVRLRFLDVLGQATRGESDPGGIMAVTAKLLGEQLQASRCAYADFGPDGDSFTIPHDWTDGVASVVGAYRLAWFGPRAADLLLGGRTLVVRDLDGEMSADPGAAAFRAIEIRAIVCCPLVKAGQLVAMMAVHQSTPRDWAASEIELVEQVVERSWAHIERARAEQQLREADRRKDEFLATLAHELRNPLAPVRSGLEILRRTASPDEARETREMMARQLEHVVRLVDDLMDVARVSTGKITLRKERVELATVVRTAVEVARHAIEGACHRLTVRFPDEPLAFDADRTRLAQVVANLLTNAAKYTDPGGHIDVSARRDGDAAVIRVADNGVGIPAAMLPKVFDLFTQIDRSLEKSQGGLGIGLTLVRKLVEMHGGRVSAASEGPGRGSAFEVRLPMWAGAPVEVVSNAGPDVGASRRVLVVDDNTDAAKSLAILLRLDGHEVRTANDGPTALDAAEEFRPEVVFLDIGLPGMNGYEVAVRLRQRPDLGRFTLIALTGWGGAEDRRRSDEAGFDRHLVKPLDPDILGDLFASVR